MSYFAGKRLFTDNANTVLAAGISAVATTATLNTGGGALFPSPTNGDYYIGTFVSATNPNLYEIVQVTAMSGDTISTMVRAQEGTTAQAWNANDTFALLFTKGAANAFQQPDPAYLKNFFVDPCCRVAQIGTGSPPTLTTAKKYGVVDLVQAYGSGSAVSAGTITQDSAGTAGGATSYSVKIAGATITGTGKVFFRRWIEANDASALAGNTATFSVRIYHDVGSAINCLLTANYATAVNNFSSVTNIGSSGTTSVPSTTSTKLTYTVAIPSGASNGIELIVEFDCGAITTKDFYATDWQLCLSNYTPNCAVPEFARDLADAMRYYEQSYEYGTAPGTNTTNGSRQIILGASVSNGSQIYGFESRFSVKKVITPVGTSYSTAGASGKLYFLGSGDVTSSVTVDTTTLYVGNNSGTVFGDTNFLRYQWTADARL